MKVTWFILAISLFVAGCDSPVFDDEIRKIVRGRLNDPGSAIFGEKIVVQSRACIYVNSKNAYGGYPGETVFHFKKFGDRWADEEREGKSCDESALVNKLAIDKRMQELFDEAESALIAKLKAKNLMGATLKSTDEIEDETCRKFAGVIMYLKRKIIADRLGKMNDLETLEAFERREELEALFEKMDGSEKVTMTYSDKGMVDKKMAAIDAGLCHGD